MSPSDIEFVILAAGKSTRNYPHSKGIPHKSLVPFGSRKVIDYIIKEPIAAGLKHITIVVSDERAKESFETCFAREKDIEDKFERSGNIIGLELLQSLYLPADVEVRYVIQSAPLGIGHAIGLVAKSSPGRHLAVRLPDDMVLSKGKPAITRALEKYISDGRGGNLIITREVEDPRRWGIIENGVFREKPESSTSREAYHSLAILDARVGEALALAMDKPFAGELHFADSLNSIVREDSAMAIRTFPIGREETYLDCGTLQGYEEALIYMLLSESPYREKNRAVARKLADG
ncbi:MAG: NTP transferase domain-containing protein [Rickettsiales bacterium]|jgi:UTP--glucose-1-phosphate uridylyltransferase|nr:NTP transferase domain-containing protein [Rickettsiales bacterium]